MRRFLVALCLVSSSFATASCLSFAASSTADIFVAASPGFEEAFDLDVAETAAASAIIQLEGIRRLKPEREDLLLQVVRAYCGYAFAFVEDDMEAAGERGDDAEEERQRRRAIHLYHRARNVGMYILRLRDDGLDQAMRGGEISFARWLREEFDDEDDAAILFWTGYAMASRINVGRDDISAAIEIPYARALVERSIQLDERYYNAAGHTFMGAFLGEFGEVVGGNPAQSRTHFERALRITRRQSLMIQVQYARSYAASRGDRALYRRLLTEVLRAGDGPSDLRLSNLVARRRAARYLRQIDDRVLE